jgi:hypothetical protein
MNEPVKVNGATIGPYMFMQFQGFQEDDYSMIDAYRKDIMDIMEFVVMGIEIDDDREPKRILEMARSLLQLMDLVESFNPNYIPKGVNLCTK